jgi:hypothetical protein
VRNPFKVQRYGRGTPYIWHGMRFGPWMRLLADGGFDVTLNCMPRILGVTLTAPINSAVHHLSETVYRRRIAETRIAPPIFIIGHWRTGTTMLHELLGLDPALASPTTFQCMFPGTFLLTEKLVGRWTKAFLPKTRTLDNVEFGPDRPQEEEFGLLNLGIGTPYRSLAFPRQGPKGQRHVDLADLSAAERHAWEGAYLGLLRRFQLAHCDRRLVLKSPLHAARIPTLIRLFPDARFVYTARNPVDVYVSTLHMLKALSSSQGLQNPIPDDDAALVEYVLAMFERLFAAYGRDRFLIPAGRRAEIRYEDLTADPIAALRGVYRDLGLDFTAAEPAVAAWLDGRQGYRRNLYDRSPDGVAAVAERWRPYFTRFGYRAEVG